MTAAGLRYHANRLNRYGLNVTEAISSIVFQAMHASETKAEWEEISECLVKAAFELSLAAVMLERLANRQDDER